MKKLFVSYQYKYVLDELEFCGVGNVILYDVSPPEDNETLKIISDTISQVLVRY